MEQLHDLVFTVSEEATGITMIRLLTSGSPVTVTGVVTAVGMRRDSLGVVYDVKVRFTGDLEEKK